MKSKIYKAQRNQKLFGFCFLIVGLCLSFVEISKLNKRINDCSTYSSTVN